MPKTLRDFPTEANRSPWPLLQPAQEDLHYMPRPKPLQVGSMLPKQPQPSQQPASQQPLIPALASGVLRGIILGIFLFGLVYSFLPLQKFWLSNWHFLYPIGGVVLLTVLLGLDITFVVLFIASISTALWFNWHMIVAHPVIPLFFIAAGIILLWIRALFFRKAQ
jgi:hypothetical protein